MTRTACRPCPAQKLIIAVGVVLLIVAGFWLVKNNLH